MKTKIQFYILILIVFFSSTIKSQNVSLYKQFNGRYDFVFLGNTLNPEENTFQKIPKINTSASAILNLKNDDSIENAYLYWAGSGDGDFEVQLNSENINPDRKFSHSRYNGPYEFSYFSAMTDITSLVKTKGNGVYTLSELDVTAYIDYHFQIKTNFAGWAIIVVYKNDNLPLNQLNIYDGLQAVPDKINITLNSLNVIDNQDAKIGFLAWEGDVGIAVNETLRINNNPIGNPPLNPVNNAFNGTNSFTNSTTLFNMDLDVYNIQNNINIGDSTANIELTSGQDFVMINAIVTKLNSQLPDASITINKVDLACNSRNIIINYTVFNNNCTNFLPANTPIAIYANSILVGTTKTTTTIPINGNEKGEISIQIPDNLTDNFDITIVVDDLGTGNGIVTEINEKNNSYSNSLTLWKSPKYNSLDPLEACNEGFKKGTFDFSNYATLVKEKNEDVVLFYDNIEDAKSKNNPILNTNHYVCFAPKEIFVRIENDHCFEITSFNLITKNCPPIVHNFISPNNDDLNDSFIIEGLRDIFVNYKISIYNRWGTLIWTGNNNTPDWKGEVNEGIKIDSQEVPDGTYFYVIDLNDPDYKEPLIGYIYLTK